MKFIKYNTKEEFLEDNLEILLKEEAKNEIMIGIVREHDSAKVNNWLLGRIEEKDEIKSIFIVDDDKNGLLFYSLEENLSEQVADFLVDNLIELNINLKEILTSKKNAKMIAEIYSKKTNTTLEESEFKYIFKFDKFNEEHILKNGEKLEKIDDLKDIELVKNNV